MEAELTPSSAQGTTATMSVGIQDKSDEGHEFETGDQGRRSPKIVIVEASEEALEENPGEEELQSDEEGEEEEDSEESEAGSDGVGFKVLGAIVSQVRSSKKPSTEGRPCKHFIDVEFTEPTDVNFISFRNHYTAFCTIKIKTWMIDSWIPLVENKKLMKDLHIEQDAQDKYILQMDNPLFDTTRVQCIRIYLCQPSPMWMHVHFAIKDLIFFRSESVDEVKEYIRHRERSLARQQQQQQASTSGHQSSGGGATAKATLSTEHSPATNGNGRESSPHALDAVSYDGSGDLSEDDDTTSDEEEGESESESDSEEDGEGEGIFDNELVIDEDLHKRLCKYLNIATDELESEKNKTEFRNRGSKEMTTSVRLSPSSSS